MWVWMNQADFNSINAKLDAILAQLGVDHRLLTAVKTEEDKIMVTQADIDAKLTQATADAAAEKSVVDSFVSLFGDILTQLAALKQTAGISQATADAIDALDQGLRDRATQMTAAMVAGTPQANPGAPPVTPAIATAAATTALAANPLPPAA